MVIAFTLFPFINNMVAMNSTVFWSVKPQCILEQLKTAAQEWEYFERQKAGLQKWCQAAEAKKKMATAKKILASCRCL